MINNVNIHTTVSTTVTPCMLDSGTQYLEFTEDVRTVSMFVPRDPHEALHVLNQVIQAAQTLAGQCHGQLDTFTPAQEAALAAVVSQPMAGSRIEEF